MAKCEWCDKQFHACSSCGLTGWEWYYCNVTCRKNHVKHELPKILAKYRITAENFVAMISDTDEEFPGNAVFNMIPEDLLEMLTEEVS